MNIVVTGGCGFIGSHLTDLLIHVGHQVTVVDNISPDRNRHGYNEKASYIHADAANLQSVLPASYRADFIYHLAAQARIQPSFIDPLYTIVNNVNSTMGALEAARSFGVPIVYATTSSKQGDIYRSPYTWSKVAGEDLLKLYGLVYGVESCSAVFYNVYGPREPKDGEWATVVSKFERMRTENVPLTIVGDGQQTRPFTHVGDVCGGLYQILAQGLCSKETAEYDLGNDTPVTINELAGYWGGEANYVPKRINEAEKTQVRQAKKLPNWQATVNLSDYVAGRRSALGL